jgi:hypothetical protein
MTGGESDIETLVKLERGWCKEEVGKLFTASEEEMKI